MQMFVCLIDGGKERNVSVCGSVGQETEWESEQNRSIDSMTCFGKQAKMICDKQNSLESVHNELPCIVNV